jgi:molybdopterin-guanine dinucleotide biosynthesis protein A
VVLQAAGGEGHTGAVTPLLGFVMAGGRSRRMERDKALLPWGAGTLLDHAVARLREVAGEVRILCGPEPRYTHVGVPVDVDRVPDSGPLGGLEAGLLQLTGGIGLFLGVDLPFVPGALLRRLVDLAAGFDAVVPVAAGGPQPLCAVYTSACLPSVRRSLDRQALQMTSFWSEVNVRVVEEAELARFGDAATMFLNVNTPEDYERARPR